MKKSIWAPLLFSALPLVQAVPTPQDAFVDEPSRARARVIARTLADEWPAAVYVIRNGRREIGSYFQTNKASLLDGENVLEFADVVSYPKRQNELRYQYVCGIEDSFGVRAIAGQSDQNRMKIAFADGHATGTQMGQTPVDMDLPENFVTDVSLLRHLIRLENKEGAARELTHVDIYELPKRTALSKGTFSYAGREELEIEGETYAAWRFNWKLKRLPKVIFWYGEHGQLLQRRVGNEVWLWSPERTRAHLERAVNPPPARRKQPARKS